MVVDSFEHRYIDILAAIFSQSDTGYPHYTHSQLNKKSGVGASPTKESIKIAAYRNKIHSFDNSKIDFDINFWNSVNSKETENRTKDDYTSSRTLSLWFSYYMRILKDDIETKITTIKNTITIAMYTNHVDTNSIIKWANQCISEDGSTDMKYIIAGFVCCFMHFSDYLEEKQTFNDYLNSMQLPSEIKNNFIMIFQHISLNGNNGERMVMDEMIFDNWKHGFHNNMVRCFTFKTPDIINDYSNLLKNETITLDHDFWIKIYDHYRDGFISFLSQKRIRQGVDRRWFNKKYQSNGKLHFTFYEFYMLTIISGHFDVKAYTEMCMKLLTNETNRQNHKNYIHYISHIMIYFYQQFIDQIKNNDNFIYTKNDYKSNKVNIENIIETINDQTNVMNISKHIATNAMIRVAQICEDMMDNTKPTTTELDQAVIDHMQNLLRRNAVVINSFSKNELAEIETNMKTLDSIFGNMVARKIYNRSESEKTVKSSFFSNIFHKKKIAIAPL